MAIAAIPSLQSPLVNVSAGAVPTQAWYRFFLRLIVTIQAGSVTLWAGAGVPSGTFECNGDAVSRTTYSALFSAIGITYGPGDGSTTFNLPTLSPIGGGVKYVIYY